MEHGWRQQWIGMHFGDSLQINDFGYLSRTNLNYGHWQVSHRITDLPKESKYTSHDWRWRVSGTNNDHGLDLQRQFRMSRVEPAADGGNEFAQINVNAPATTTASCAATASSGCRPTSNASSTHHGRARATGSYVRELKRLHRRHRRQPQDRLERRTSIRPTTSPMPSTSTPACRPTDAELDGLAARQPGRHLRRARRAARRRRELEHRRQAGAAREAAGARPRRAAEAGLPRRARRHAGAAPSRSTTSACSQLGFQIRYRYELAPLSDLYVVYGRGGFDQEYERRRLRPDARQLLAARHDQILVKVSYRFDN